MQARISRRGALKAGVAAAAAASVGGTALDLATNSASAVTTPSTLGKAAESTGFAPIAPARTTDDAFRVPAGYVADVLLRWGDPVLPGAPKFDVGAQTGSAQAQQCGYNHDFQAFFPIGDASTEGVLWVNHEYTDPYRMIPGWNGRTTNLDQLRAWVDIDLAAHGGTIVELARANATSKWEVRPGKRNRRITANTPMRMSGPAAQDERLAGQVLGTLNNCGGGVTPWGTVLTAEENFNQYFANNDRVADATTKAVHARYGLLPAASERGWERVYPNRFDASIVPNEPFKFGWIVEIDPDDPNSTPVKRTALGRFKHEAATVVVAPSGQIAVYSGDDERFEFFYKFVSYGVYDPKKGKANGALLDEGTLYVAKLEADGSAQWIPLEHNRRAELTARTGFRDQADVLLRTRRDCRGRNTNGPAGGRRGQPAHREDLRDADQQRAPHDARRRRCGDCCEPAIRCQRRQQDRTHLGADREEQRPHLNAVPLGHLHARRQPEGGRQAGHGTEGRSQLGRHLLRRLRR